MQGEGEVKRAYMGGQNGRRSVGIAGGMKGVRTNLDYRPTIGPWPKIERNDELLRLKPRSTISK